MDGLKGTARGIFNHWGDIAAFVSLILGGIAFFNPELGVELLATARSMPFNEIVGWLCLTFAGILASRRAIVPAFRAVRAWAFGPTFVGTAQTDADELRRSEARTWQAEVQQELESAQSSSIASLRREVGELRQAIDDLLKDGGGAKLRRTISRALELARRADKSLGKVMHKVNALEVPAKKGEAAYTSLVATPMLETLRSILQRLKKSLAHLEERPRQIFEDEAKDYADWSPFHRESSKLREMMSFVYSQDEMDAILTEMLETPPSEEERFPRTDEERDIWRTDNEKRVCLAFRHKLRQELKVLLGLSGKLQAKARLPEEYEL